MNSSSYSLLVELIVLLNVIVLSLDNLVKDNYLIKLNIFCNYFFILDNILKIIAFGN